MGACARLFLFQGEAEVLTANAACASLPCCAIPGAATPALHYGLARRAGGMELNIPGILHLSVHECTCLGHRQCSLAW